MAAHGLRSIAFGRATEPGHVLGVAWILAGQPVFGDDGADAVARLRTLGVSRVRFVPVRGPAVGSLSTESALASSDSTAAMRLDDFEVYELGELYPFGAGTVSGPPGVPPRSVPNRFSAATTPPRPPMPSVGGPRAAPDTPEGLIERLRDSADLNGLAHALDAVSAAVWSEVGAHRVAKAAYLASEVIRYESTLSDPQAKRSVQMAVRRYGDSHLIALVVTDLPRAREQREHHAQYMVILDRFGDSAVDVLLDQLTYAELARDRRALFDAIVALGRGMPTLIRMLGDDRWYVVRNAAVLLGRLKAVGAEAPLVKVLRHDEPRVRHAAAQALAKLGTPEALGPLRTAIGDAAPEVRRAGHPGASR